MTGLSVEERARLACGSVAPPVELRQAEAVEDVQPSDAEEIARLAKMKPAEYDRARKEAALRLGIRPSTLDDEVKRSRKGGDTGDTAGGRAILEDTTPWPSPVNPAQVLDAAHALLKRFVVADAATLHAATAWAAMTWFSEYATVLPLAMITAPEKGCGKTVLLSTIARLARKSLSTSNISPAALFRAVDAWQPTLIIDEADAFLKENEELRGILNSGHTRDTAHVIRAVEVNGEFEPRIFSTWGAKAIAGIGRLPETVESRSVILKMRRALPGEKAGNLRHADRGEFQVVQRKFARWAADDGRRFANLHPELPELSNRDADNWEPLLALADLAGGDWPKLIRSAAYALTAKAENPTANEELLGDIKTVFERKGRDRLKTEELLEGLSSDPEAPWATWNRGKPITARQLSKRLAEFGIAPGTVRFDGSNAYSRYLAPAQKSTAKGYRLAQFEDAFRRYLPDTYAESVTPSQSNDGAVFSDFASVTPDNHVTDEKPRKPSNGAGCDGVTDENPFTVADEARERILSRFAEASA